MLEVFDRVRLNWNLSKAAGFVTSETGCRRWRSWQWAGQSTVWFNPVDHRGQKQQNIPHTETKMSYQSMGRATERNGRPAMIQCVVVQMHCWVETVSSTTVLCLILCKVLGALPFHSPKYRRVMCIAFLLLEVPSICDYWQLPKERSWRQVRQSVKAITLSQTFSGGLGEQFSQTFWQWVFSVIAFYPPFVMVVYIVLALFEVLSTLCHCLLPSCFSAAKCICCTGWIRWLEFYIYS